MRRWYIVEATELAGDPVPVHCPTFDGGGAPKYSHGDGYIEIRLNNVSGFKFLIGTEAVLDSQDYERELVSESDWDTLYLDYPGISRVGR